MCGFDEDLVIPISLHPGKPMEIEYDMPVIGPVTSCNDSPDYDPSVEDYFFPCGFQFDSLFMTEDVLRNHLSTIREGHRVHHERGHLPHGTRWRMSGTMVNDDEGYTVKIIIRCEDIG